MQQEGGIHGQEKRSAEYIFTTHGRSGNGVHLLCVIVLVLGFEPSVGVPCSCCGVLLLEVEPHHAWSCWILVHSWVSSRVLFLFAYLQRPVFVLVCLLECVDTSVCFVFSHLCVRADVLLCVTLSVLLCVPNMRGLVRMFCVCMCDCVQNVRALSCQANIVTVSINSLVADPESSDEGVQCSPQGSCAQHLCGMRPQKHLLLALCADWSGRHTLPRLRFLVRPFVHIPHFSVSVMRKSLLCPFLFLSLSAYLACAGDPVLAPILILRWSVLWSLDFPQRVSLQTPLCQIHGPSRSLSCGQRNMHVQHQL